LKDIEQKSLKDVKETLEGPISTLPSGVGKDTVSAAASIFLARKVLPGTGTKSEAEKKLFTKLTSPGPAAAGEDWYDSAADVISRLFPIGWDSDWDQYVHDSKRVNQTACLEKDRTSRGVCESLGGWGEWTDRLESGELHPISEKRKIAAVKDGGKWRVITKAGGALAQLRPLHDIIYNTLSKNRWLLRGEPDAKEMTKQMEGEDGNLGRGVFVSGDYEAATDNFVPANSSRILDMLRATSRSIPAGVWEEADSSVLGGEIVREWMTYEDRGGERVRVRKSESAPRVTGQLMGDYLSFPLLCLTNFIGVIYALGDEGWRIACEGFLKVNGDDIVFRATKASANKWMEDVVGAGLVLSRGKTMVHSRVFSINSLFYTVSSRASIKLDRILYCKAVPVIRFKTWCKPSSTSLEGRVKRILVDAHGQRRRILELFFGYVWGRVASRGLPSSICRSNVFVALGWCPKDWRERNVWWQKNRALMGGVAPVLGEIAEFKGLFVTLNHPVGRQMKGVQRAHDKSAAYGRTALEWNLYNVAPKPKFDDEPVPPWADVIPMEKAIYLTPSLYQTHIADHVNKRRLGDLEPLGLPVAVGRRYVNRAGLGSAVEAVYGVRGEERIASNDVPVYHRAGSHLGATYDWNGSFLNERTSFQ
jgi:hypothetical protein